MAQTETLDQVQKVGRERLYPSLTNPNWLVLRKRRKLFQRWLAELPQQSVSVLDVGGRIQPYRALVPRVARYVAVDLRPTSLVSVIANAEHLPFAEQQFDLVLCTQMLEYAPDPGRVVSEIYRVLKAGGIFLCSVPSLALRDSDEDRWRFWPAGIRQLLPAFSQVEIIPEGGSIAGLFRTVNASLCLVVKYSVMRAALCLSVIPVLNLAGLALENLLGSRNDALAVNYAVWAKKGLTIAGEPSG